MTGTLAVGFFDGVHLGHRSILTGSDEALTFRNHPLSVLAPERAPRLIMSFEDRIAAIRSCGVGKVTVLDFTRELANIEPKAFADEYLSGRKIRCGSNWRFGKGGKGDAAFLRALGSDVTVVPPVTLVDEASSPRHTAIISSTRIRAAIESGEIAAANVMMGRPFQVRGVPFVGKGEGRSLGFPTVNLRSENLQLNLPLGVYAVEVGGARGIANYGRAPTFDARAWTEPVMEVHFVDGLPKGVDTRLAMIVRFERFIRPERKFASLAELQSQIAADIASRIT